MYLPRVLPPLPGAAQRCWLGAAFSFIRLTSVKHNATFIERDRFEFHRAHHVIATDVKVRMKANLVYLFFRHAWIASLYLISESGHKLVIGLLILCPYWILETWFAPDKVSRIVL